MVWVKIASLFLPLLRSLLMTPSSISGKERLSWTKPTRVFLLSSRSKGGRLIVTSMVQPNTSLTPADSKMQVNNGLEHVRRKSRDYQDHPKVQPSLQTFKSVGSGGTDTYSDADPSPFSLADLEVM